MFNAGTKRSTSSLTASVLEKAEGLFADV